jgi:NitT/TauT family transport system substrate-binding protein
MRIVTTLLAGAAFALGATLAGAQTTGPAPKPLAKRETVKMVLASAVEAYAPLYVAKELGEFAKENLDVEYVNVGATEVLLVLSRGQGDAWNGLPSAAAFNAIAQGAEIRMVAPGQFVPPNTKQGVWVAKSFLAGRPYSPALLKGQTIASSVGAGSSTSYYIALELEKAGLTMKDIGFRLLPVNDIVLALENGAVSFGTLNSPQNQKVDQSKAEFAFGIQPGYSIGGLFFGPRLLKERRDVGEAFMRAWVRGIRTHLQGDYHENPKVMEALAKSLQIPAAAIKQGPSLVFPPDQPMVAGMMDKLQAAYAATPGILSYAQAMPESRIVDRSFLDAAKR